VAKDLPKLVAGWVLSLSPLVREFQQLPGASFDHDLPEVPSGYFYVNHRSMSS
jgi:hypothetical protein